MEINAVDRERDHMLINVADPFSRYIMAHHPFDVVGWDGMVYPYTFNADDFEPITGTITNRRRFIKRLRHRALSFAHLLRDIWIIILKLSRFRMPIPMSKPMKCFTTSGAISEVVAASAKRLSRCILVESPTARTRNDRGQSAHDPDRRVGRDDGYLQPIEDHPASNGVG